MVSNRATPITATGATPAQWMTLDKRLQASLICHEQVQIQDSRAKKVHKYFYSDMLCAHVQSGLSGWMEKMNGGSPSQVC